MLFEGLFFFLYILNINIDNCLIKKKEAAENGIFYFLLLMSNTPIQCVFNRWPRHPPCTYKHIMILLLMYLLNVSFWTDGIHVKSRFWSIEFFLPSISVFSSSDHKQRIFLVTFLIPTAKFHVWTRRSDSHCFWWVFFSLMNTLIDLINPKPRIYVSWPWI